MVYFDKEAEKIIKESKHNVMTKIAGRMEDFNETTYKVSKKIDYQGYKNLDNIWITYNNKVLYLESQFREAGISMFAQIRNGKIEAENSFLGSAIIRDLQEKTNQGERLKYSSYEHILGLQQKHIKQIYKNFKPEKNMEELQKKIKTLKLPKKESIIMMDMINKYKKCNDEIFNYNLKDNIIESILEMFDLIGYDNRSTLVTEEYILPDIRQLGLESIIPSFINKYNERVIRQEQRRTKHEYDQSPEI